ncbi:hypothetical protein FRC19_009703 [Serendipita sp. 401]|nr:hypothetical protein FRC19_009703 [Serendipita sp. 401]KAG9057012.1 hypothetical protein FS842_008945 [Serendipita sp. 407]
MAYVYKTTEEFFTNRTPDGRRIWDRLKGRNISILCTPNGWSTSDQVFLRDAAIAARILSADEVDDHLVFITEGEASVHYAHAYTKSDTRVKKDVMLAVVDAGGSTVDSTLYICTSSLPRVTLEEAGGIFVNLAFREDLCKRLTCSKLNEDEVIDSIMIMKEFEAKTKRLFDETQESSVIQSGRNKDNDPDFGIMKRIINSLERLIGNKDVHVSGSFFRNQDPHT